MKNYFNKLKNFALFESISENNFEKMLNCLDGHIKNYKKGSAVFLAGDNVSSIGVIISGVAKVIKEDAFGNSSIIAKLSDGDVFAETFAFSKMDNSPVSVFSLTDVTILFINYRKIVRCCSSVCEFHTTLIENILKIISSKNIELTKKIEHISKRTIREKLLSYLVSQMNGHQKSKFYINFTRSELADYLCVDRSAMSRELCKMRDEGILKFELNKFEIVNIT